MASPASSTMTRVKCPKADGAATLPITPTIAPQYLDLANAGRVPAWLKTSAWTTIIAGAICLWLIAIRSPLWIDETGSWWQINAGFSQIWGRQTITFPAYFYVLWAWTKIAGTTELAMRVLSLLAMLGAVAVLYRAASELMGRAAARIAVVVFCIHPFVVFESIDIRPYAFVALAINLTIMLLIRLRRSQSTALAAAFGLATACILYFHYLSGVLLPALLACFFVLKARAGRTMWRQLGVALGVFAMAMLPTLRGLHYDFSTRASHVGGLPPKFTDLLYTLAPGPLPFIAVLVGTVALIIVGLKAREAVPTRHLDRTATTVCLLLGLIPICLLFAISVKTPVFAPRYELCTIPGIALCWGYLLDRLRPSPLRIAFCAALVLTVAILFLHTPKPHEHMPTWKYALAYIQKADVNNEPVLVSSNFIESDYVPMPPDSDAAKMSQYFAPLSYYRISPRVVPLPLDVNAETIRAASRVLAEAEQKHESFFAFEQVKGYPTIGWLTRASSGSFEARKVGTFDYVEVIHFVPRTPQRK